MRDWRVVEAEPLACAPACSRGRSANWHRSNVILADRCYSFEQMLIAQHQPQIIDPQVCFKAEREP